MNERNKVLKAADDFKLESPFYDGPYGTIKIVVTDLDNRIPGPRVRFLSVSRNAKRRARRAEIRAEKAPS